MIYISTDYVFDGSSKEPIKEDATPNPLSVYGGTKLDGEKVTREIADGYVLRTSWVYGEGHNFVRTMLRFAQSNKSVDVVGDQTGCPTGTADLAKCMINLIEAELYGTYHATCEGSCSWYDFAKKIFELAGIDVRVNKISTEQLRRPAKRPRYTVLDNYMLKLIGLNTFRNWEDALEEYIGDMAERKGI
jgi:dTDP-4-dehydrorhamnose reductase